MFTSNQASPASGDWRSIRFYNTTDDASTVLEHCTIQYAGYGDQGQIFIDNASPALNNCSLSNSSNYDLYYYGTVGGTVSGCTLNSGIYLLATSTVNFTGNTFIQNNSYPIKSYADNVHSLVNGNTFANLDDDSHLEITSGNVTKDAAWTAGIPYLLLASMTIQGVDGADGITTLTIEPGAEVRFNSNIQLNVGASSGNPGSLIAQGTQTDPIMFTSNQASPASGDWRSIRFYNTTDDASTVLEHCSIQYAGYGDQGQIFIDNASPALNNCSFSNSSNYDLYYYGTVGGTVSGCTLNSGIYLLATSTVGFAGNTFNYNNSYPFQVYGDNVGDIVYGNTFSNLDSVSYLAVSGDVIEHDATWTAAIPYVITGIINILGADGADGITTLTIEPGAEVRFNSNIQLNVGASSGNPGSLIAQGTQTDPIVFTSNQASPASGDWRGIKFYNTTDDASTVLEHCTIQYAGYSNQGQISIDNASPALNNCSLSNSSNYDLYYYGTVGGTVSGCTLNSGIYLLATSTVGFTGNTFNYNPAFPSKTYADHVGSLVTGNTFTGLDSSSYLYVNSGNVTKDATWTSAIPIYINSNITVQGVDGADGITTLTVGPGTVIKFNQSTYLNVGYTSGNPGSLTAQGTAEQQIIFTSNNPSPSPGNWQGIRFYNTTDDATSSLIYCIVEYAGSGSQGAVHVNQAKPVIHNSIISNNTAYGLYITGSGATDTDIHCNTFVGNGYGIFAANSAIPIVLNNNFNRNSTCGLYNASATAIVAEDNWWGGPKWPQSDWRQYYRQCGCRPLVDRRKQLRIIRRKQPSSYPRRSISGRQRRSYQYPRWCNTSLDGQRPGPVG